jgi:two-component system phosphate regulon response regulator OmpR
MFLSAMGGPEERVKGLSLGAKDYIMKPFEPAELLLRLKNLIPSEYILDLGARYFNVRNGHLYDQTHQTISITELERSILLYMAKHINQPVSRETFMSLFFSTASNIRVVDVTLSRLRKKLDPENTSPQVLCAVRNQGYIFQAQSKRSV